MGERRKIVHSAPLNWWMHTLHQEKSPLISLAFSIWCKLKVWSWKVENWKNFEKILDSLSVAVEYHQLSARQLICLAPLTKLCHFHKQQRTKRSNAGEWSAGDRTLNIPMLTLHVSTSNDLVVWVTTGSVLTLLSDLLFKSLLSFHSLNSFSSSCFFLLLLAPDTGTPLTSLQSFSLLCPYKIINLPNCFFYSHPRETSPTA